MKKTTQALQYLLVDGYSIIPIGNKKVPLLKRVDGDPDSGWAPYQEKHADEETVRGWYERWPDMNIGIVTGKVSGITVVDIDVKHDGHVTPDIFPPTYTVQTKSGGWHLYYEYYEGISNSASLWEGLVGVDIRNDGGYVIAPPSEGYTVVDTNGGVLGAFPKEMFKEKRGSRKAGKGFDLQLVTGVGEGGRNQAMASLIGALVGSRPESEWSTKVWAAVQAANRGYNPPLPPGELEATFRSIASREKQRREEAQAIAVGAVKSPLEMDDVMDVALRGSKSGVLYKDTLNAMLAFAGSREWSGVFKFDAFTNNVEYKGEPIKEHHVIEAQAWLQGEMGLHGISKAIVNDAIEKRAQVCSYNSAVDWLQSLEWDGVPRVDTWVPRVYGVEDSQYYRSIGSNWLRALVKRLVVPGTKFDHVLVIQGGQGVRKTTSFAVLGGPWHIETIVQAESKDFLMQFDGKAVIELSEGDTLNRSETRALKAIITRTHDKYRAPYARRDEEHPRRCVFCMTTNDIEFLKDETGNRRWWIVVMPDEFMADTPWLAENREQLFAEAYARRDEDWLEVPQDVALAMQENARVVDMLEGQVMDWYLGLDEVAREDGVTVWDFWSWLYRDPAADKTPRSIPWNVETKIKNTFKGALKLSYLQRRREGSRVRRWFPTEKTPKMEFEAEKDF